MATTEEKVQPKLAEVSLDDIPEIQREGKASRVVEEFLASGMQAAKVEDHAPSFNLTLNRYIKKNSVPVEVLKRGGDIFLRYKDATVDETPTPEADPEA